MSLKDWRTLFIVVLAGFSLQLLLDLILIHIRG
jgi:hypothetical protein